MTSMNKKIGVIASIINVVSVALFGLSMIISGNELGYLSSMFIAFSFVAMLGCYAVNSAPNAKAAGITGAVVAGMYATIIVLVYFAQLTTVRLTELSPELANILNYKKFGLMFNYDLLGYGLMALATFFAGLSFRAEKRSDKWLKALLLIHGVFFFACLIFPMTGIFSVDSEAGDVSGTILLLFWCVYFLPIGVLSAVHFKGIKE